jgi:hypothetical protein
VQRKRLLVVAVDKDLRKSLEFLLGTEGHVVTTLAEIPAGGGGYDATILDHRAANGRPASIVTAFCRTASPVVLLAGVPQTWLTQQVFVVVRLPVKGDALTLALQEALALGKHLPR